jgi:hypothetical protein
MCRRPLLNDKLREVSSFPQPLSGHVKSVRRRFEKILLRQFRSKKSVKSHVMRLPLIAAPLRPGPTPERRGPRPSTLRAHSVRRRTEEYCTPSLTPTQLRVPAPVQRGVLYSEPDSDIDSDTTPCVRTFTEIVNDDLASQIARIDSMAMR